MANIRKCTDNVSKGEKEHIEMSVDILVTTLAFHQIHSYNYQPRIQGEQVATSYYLIIFTPSCSGRDQEDKFTRHVFYCSNIRILCMFPFDMLLRLDVINLSL